jgi:RND family efflux transporter MFP subunit
MRKILLILVVAILVAGGAWYYRASGPDTAAASTSTNAAGSGRGAAAGRGTGGRTPMTVDTAVVTRHEVVDYITVVGNLIGEATVDVCRAVAGRIDSVSVKLGDQRGTRSGHRQDRGPRDSRANQSGAGHARSEQGERHAARKRSAAAAETRWSARRRRSSAGLTARQLLEDAEARYNAAASQLLVCPGPAVTDAVADRRAQDHALQHHRGSPPVDGFVSRRNLDPGAFANANTVLLQVVDIGTVRLVANLVEKGFKKVTPGVEAKVQVDTFAGEDFTGRVSRVAPVFDPATRTAQMEIEVPNPGFRLKPGMYARVRLTLERRPDALTVPSNAVVDADGKRGVFIVKDQTAKFVVTKVGLSDGERIEIVEGLKEGDRVITTGALALRDGDRVALVSDTAGRGGRTGGRAGSRGADAGGTTGAPGRGTIRTRHVDTSHRDPAPRSRCSCSRPS